LRSTLKIRVYWNLKIIFNAYYLQQLKTVYVSSVVAEHTNIETRPQSEKHIRHFHDMTRPTFHTWRGVFVHLLNLRVRDLGTNVLSWPQWWRNAWPPVRLLNQAWWKIVFGLKKLTKNQNRRRTWMRKTSRHRLDKIQQGYQLPNQGWLLRRRPSPATDRVSLSVFNADNWICAPRVVLASIRNVIWCDAIFLFSNGLLQKYDGFFSYSLVKRIIKMINNKVIIDIIKITKLTLVNLLFIITTPFVLFLFSYAWIYSFIFFFFF